MTEQDECEALATILYAHRAVAYSADKVACRCKYDGWNGGAKKWQTPTEHVEHVAKKLAKAGFHRPHQITEAEVEAAREAYANEQERQRDEQVGRLTNTIKGRTENARARMRAALEAAAEGARRG